MTTDAVIAELDEANPRLIKHYNDTYGDAVDIVCRAHLKCDEVRGARFLAFDVNGLTAHATDANGNSEDIRVEFPNQVTSLMNLEELTLAAIAEARSALGIATLTTAEQQTQQVNEIKTYVTSVVRTEQISPTFRQITFGGGDLIHFEPGGLDQFIYVMNPPYGKTELSVDSSFRREDFGSFTEETQPVGAYYTVRAWRPEQAEIDMLYVLHGAGANHTPTPGTAAEWAMNAKPGDKAAMWGPRTAYEPPADTDWVLLAGDETALPAISVILENLPEGTPAHAFIEIGNDADRLPLPQRADIHVHWLHRGSAPAGTTHVLSDALHNFTFPHGTVYAWGGAESAEMRAATKVLRRERGVERHRIRMVGYWLHTETDNAS